MISAGTYSDLHKRILTAIVLLCVLAGAFSAGDIGILVFLSVFCGVILWEVAKMVSVGMPMVWACLGGVAMFASGFVHFVAPSLAAVLIAALAALTVSRVLGMVFVVLTLAFFSYFTMFVGFPAMAASLVGIVIATDVGGYFCGRFIGGPKVAPKLSPKKTWAGVIGGWISAVIVVQFLSLPVVSGWAEIGVTVMFSVASQIGDFSQSALKRRFDVKDSSALLPGHGGFFDRCDGFIGAGVLAAPLILMV